MTEKITAVRHENNKDVWVITHDWNNNGFHSYLITNEGLQENPVSSYLGTVHRGGGPGANAANNAIGQMKVSPDGKKLALAIYSAQTVDIFDFNNNTGKVSDANTLVQPILRSAYGIEFSPDGSKLYISTVLTRKIFQVNVDVKPYAPIEIVSLQQFHHLGALQLAPDGKIYISRVDQPFLGAIENPNDPAWDIIFVRDAVLLDNGSVKDIPNVFHNQYGLPNFIQSYFYNYDFTFSYECGLNGIKFTLESSSSARITSVAWDFGDPASGNLNTATARNPVHAYSEQGNYEASVTVTFADGTVKTQSQTVKAEPRVNLGGDKGICRGDSIILDVSQFGDTYLWQDGTSEPVYVIKSSGNYWVEVISNGCKSRDMIKVEEVGSPSLDLGDDMIVCSHENVFLDASVPYATYLWNDGSTAPLLEVGSDGVYWVTVFAPCGVISDTIAVKFAEIPELNLGEDTIFLCIEKTITFDAFSPAAVSYLWSNGAVSSSVEVAAEGLYWVEVKGKHCAVRDTVQVIYEECPSELFIPNVFTPNNDGDNDTFVVLGIKSDLWILEIFNRWGDLVVRRNGYRNDWSAEGVSAGTYYYHLYNPVTKKGHKGWVQVVK